MRVLLVVALCVASPVFAQPTTVCDLLKSPERHARKIVTVRSPVPIAFEQFALPADHCADRQIDAVWLEYGRGPKRQPTVWCCGDMVPRDPLVLVQNADFRRFHRYLTAQRNSRYQFAVTATLTGRFDYSRAEICPDGKSRCCLDGFGHFGAACARIVI